MNASQNGYVQVKVKCLRCGLHFVICTWQPERHGRKSLVCPECHQTYGFFAVWWEYVPGFIFETVPGEAELMELGIDSQADSGVPHSDDS